MQMRTKFVQALWRIEALVPASDAEVPAQLVEPIVQPCDVLLEIFYVRFQLLIF